MTRPNFLILGAQKCGTTWLARTLSRQNGVYIPKAKEIHYFTRHYDRGPDWYHQAFDSPDAQGAKAIGEATPNYLAITYPEYREAARRIADYDPDMRFILILRNPIERAISAYLHHVARGRFNPLHGPERHFRDIIDGRTPGYGIIEHGLYGQQLEHYFSLFDRSNFHILVYEEMVARDGCDVVRDLLAFLGLPVDNPIGPFDERHNVSLKSRQAAHIGSMMSIWMRSDRIRMRYGGLTAHAAKMVDRVTGGQRLCLSDCAQALLVDRFCDDMKRLQTVLGRPAPIWPTMLLQREET